MTSGFWNVFMETGEPMCFLLCKAEEKDSSPEVRPIPEEFRMNPPERQESSVPRAGC